MIPEFLPILKLGNYYVSCFLIAVRTRVPLKLLWLTLKFEEIALDTMTCVKLGRNSEQPTVTNLQIQRLSPVLTDQGLQFQPFLLL